MISKSKKSLLHVGAQKLGLSDPEYRHILIEHTGRFSSADPDFTDEDFKKVIDHMKAIGFWVNRKWEQSKPHDAGDLPTVPQLKIIEHLWNDLAQYNPGANHLPYRRGFYEKRLSIAALGPQTRAQANAVIEALKNRVAREMRLAVRRGVQNVQAVQNVPGMGAKEPA